MMMIIIHRLENKDNCNCNYNGNDNGKGKGKAEKKREIEGPNFAIVQATICRYFIDSAR